MVLQTHTLIHITYLVLVVDKEAGLQLSVVVEVDNLLLRARMGWALLGMDLAEVVDIVVGLCMHKGMFIHQ